MGHNVNGRPHTDHQSRFEHTNHHRRNTRTDNTDGDPGTSKHTLNRSNPGAKTPGPRGKGALRLDDACMTDRGRRPSTTPALRRDPPGGHHDNWHIPLFLAVFTWPRIMVRDTTGKCNARAQRENIPNQGTPQHTIQRKTHDNHLHFGNTPK